MSIIIFILQIKTLRWSDVPCITHLKGQKSELEKAAWKVDKAPDYGSDKPDFTLALSIDYVIYIYIYIYLIYRLAIYIYIIVYIIVLYIYIYYINNLEGVNSTKSHIPHVWNGNILSLFLNSSWGLSGLYYVKAVCNKLWWNFGVYYFV